MRILLTLLIIVLPLSLSAQIRVFDTHTPDSCSPNGQNSRQCPQGPLYQVQLVPLAVGLTLPRQIAFLPEGDFLVSELEDIRIVQDNELSSDPISGWPDRVLSSQSLMSVIVHPQFEQNAYIYVWYAKVRGEDDEESTMALARARLDLDELSLSDVEDIFVADAWSDLGGPFSGRAEFGPDGKIYLSINDHDPLWETDDPSIRMNSQALDYDSGKIMRINDDGSIPQDNPFVGQTDKNPQIYAYGFRNVTGLAWHPETGELWGTEIGPMGGDELNIIRPGANYGWPLVSLGLMYGSSLPSGQSWYRPDMEMPEMYWMPAISPGSVMFYTGDVYPQWNGHVFVGALGGQMLQRAAFNHPPPQTQRRDAMFIDMHARFRDVKQGPDGYIYVLTEQRPGRNTGAVYRIEPAN